MGITAARLLLPLFARCCLQREAPLWQRLLVKRFLHRQCSTLSAVSRQSSLASPRCGMSPEMALNYTWIGQLRGNGQRDRVSLGAVRGCRAVAALRTAVSAVCRLTV